MSGRTVAAAPCDTVPRSRIDKLTDSTVHWFCADSNPMLFTKCGCLLLICSALAVCLFCWLSYSIIKDARTNASGESRHTRGAMPRHNVADTDGTAVSG